tara:strand:+ start:323 stop:631 length:309 start_codon:yes stop_codon:yes gene_type:complete
MGIKKNIEVKAGKSKWYYEYDRNLEYGEQMNQTEDKRIPEYYKGKNGYEARKVCDNFDLSYHLGTAVTYILRSYHKHKTPVECLTKAIAHLQFEIEKYNEEK